LLIGLRGQPVEEPLQKGALRSQKDIMFLTPYSELAAQVQSIEARPDRERYGRPLFYTLQMGGSGTVQSRKVHWSRVIHVAEDTLEDDTYGTPRLESVLNRLFDHEK